MNKSDDKQARFAKLLDYYAMGLYLSYKLIDSGLLERKIKVGTKSDDIKGVIRQFIPAFASDLRQADQEKEIIKSVENYGIDYFGSAVELANAYFYELQLRGNEWEYADLRDLFSDYKKRAEQRMEADRSY